jgi:aspartokinase
VGRKEMVVVDMTRPESWQRVGLIADIGAIFRSHGLSIDMFSSSMNHVTLAVDPAANRLTEPVVESLLQDLEALGVPKLIQATAAVSVVGTSIGDGLHELGPFLQHFEHENVHLVSHAANDLSLTVLVDGAAWDRLVQQLHDRLFDHGGREDESFGPSWQSLEATGG